MNLKEKIRAFLEARATDGCARHERHIYARKYETVKQLSLVAQLCYISHPNQTPTELVLVESTNCYCFTVPLAMKGECIASLVLKFQRLSRSSPATES